MIPTPAGTKNSAMYLSIGFAATEIVSGLTTFKLSSANKMSIPSKGAGKLN